MKVLVVTSSVAGIVLSGLLATGIGFGINESIRNTTVCNKLNVTNELEETNTAVGIILSTSSGILNGIGLNIQKISHKNQVSLMYFESIRWWLGFLFITISEVMTGVSYGFAPAAVVSSLGSVTIITNLVLAKFILNEVVTNVQVMGTLTIVAGSALLAITTPESYVVFSPLLLIETYTSYRTIGYLSFSVVSIALFIYGRKRERFQFVRLILFSSIVSSWTVISLRGLFSLIVYLPTCSQIYMSALPWILLFVLLSSAIWAGAFLEQKGLAKFNQSVWVPVHYTACSIIFGLSSSFIYDEISYISTKSLISMTFGSFLCIVGVLQISFKWHDYLK